jgi:hypothetical protein
MRYMDHPFVVLLKKKIMYRVSIERFRTTNIFTPIRYFFSASCLYLMNQLKTEIYMLICHNIVELKELFRI